VDTRAPWEPCEITPQIGALERELDGLLAGHLGIDGAEYARIPAVARSRPRGNDLDDHLMVRVLRLVGLRWPAGAAANGPLGEARASDVAAQLGDVLTREGAPDLGLDLDGWILHRLPRYQESRFRQRPVISVANGVIALTGPAGAN
jgi:hypothetical protein